MRRTITVLLAIGLLAACSSRKKELPRLGPMTVNGSDTAFYRIPAFEFLDQDSQVVSNESLAGKIYVADFFFTSCPTICPKMTKEMDRAYRHYKGNERVHFLSHTIDTRHDSIPVLRKYAEKMDVTDARQWHFVWGPREEIYDMAKAYFQVAYPDSMAPGGFVHSGQFALVDGEGYIRAFYNGTDPEEIDEMIRDIDRLLSE